MSSDTFGGFDKPTITWRTAVPTVARWLRNMPRAIRAARRDELDETLLEKVALAVTAVNECESCTRYHTEQAQEAGISEETVRQILEHDVQAAVEDDELPALKFAQRFAEADANPDPEVIANLREAYDPETANDVLAAAHEMHFANLMGNTTDLLKLRAEARARQLRNLPRNAREAIGNAL
ncbi:carboxymuconolactone decarboxylase family protein [Halorussus caseinilyticus]|uniref:Carboxymuconolactone decarboxylase family protein n=1 Tax=Halorussus caseinilyticus TaxID=3034025 RepID=A0ABD5WPW8_9EURY|nr:carboxymuconolactone decarboxylase family protein [Halorussus sp. DT72]